MPFYIVLLPFLVSLALVMWVHPKVVRYAKHKNIVDNPDARKLQKTPVPILGGVAVFFGAFVAVGASSLLANTFELLPACVAMLVMLAAGVADDIKGLSPGLRFLIEIAVVVFLIYASGRCIDDFHGIWGVHGISRRTAVPLTVFACVGIINAINLVDGVNGLSSGLGILACLLFGVYFILAGNVAMAILASATMGALIPFFMHNVFGKKSRMFIGDGGALTLGLVLSIFVVSILRYNAPGSEFATKGIGLIPLTVAVLSMPVADTLRVMITRIIKGKSPFHPDKTHLHHIILSLGASHLVTTIVILSANLLVILAWLVSVLLGASFELQFYIVVSLALAATLGLYYYLRYHQLRQTPVFLRLHRLLHVNGFTHKLYKFLKFRRFWDGL